MNKTKNEIQTNQYDAEAQGEEIIEEKIGEADLIPLPEDDGMN